MDQEPNLNVPDPKLSIEELARILIAQEGINGTFSEMGCGAPIYDSICAQPGSSKVVKEGVLPNSKERQEELGKPKNARSISIEAVRGILHHLAETRNDVTTLVSSWQIPSDPQQPVETHGWIALRQMYGNQARELFVHLTLDVGQARDKARQCIANAGLRLLISKGDPNQMGCLYADQMQDAEGKHLIHQALAQFEHLPEDAEHLVLINEKGELQRPMDYLREMNKKGQMPVYKGSFNPMTEAHRTIAQTAEIQTGIKPILMISASNYTKGRVSSASIVKRVEFINALGYGVMVCSNGTFVGNSDMLKKRGFEGQILYLAGADTAAKLSYADKEKLKKGGHKVFLAGRGPENVEVDTDLFVKLDTPEMDISSTQIRNREEGWEKGIPKDKMNKYLNIFGEIHQA